jgi:hypothetical protein
MFPGARCRKPRREPDGRTARIGRWNRASSDPPRAGVRRRTRARLNGRPRRGGGVQHVRPRHHRPSNGRLAGSARGARGVNQARSGTRRMISGRRVRPSSDAARHPVAGRCGGRVGTITRRVRSIPCSPAPAVCLGRVFPPCVRATLGLPRSNALARNASVNHMTQSFVGRLQQLAHPHAQALRLLQLVVRLRALNPRALADVLSRFRDLVTDKRAKFVVLDAANHASRAPGHSTSWPTSSRWWRSGRGSPARTLTLEAPRVRLERTTLRLTAGCSAN